MAEEEIKFARINSDGAVYCGSCGAIFNFNVISNVVYCGACSALLTRLPTAEDKLAERYHGGFCRDVRFMQLMENGTPYCSACGALIKLSSGG